LKRAGYSTGDISKNKILWKILFLRWGWLIGDDVNLAFGDFPKRYYSLPVFAGNNRAGPLVELFRSKSRCVYKREAVFDVFQTILNRDSCHDFLLESPALLVGFRSKVKEFAYSLWTESLAIIATP